MQVTIHVEIVIQRKVDFIKKDMMFEVILLQRMNTNAIEQISLKAIHCFQHFKVAEIVNQK